MEFAARTQHFFFYLYSLHIGVRQGPLPKFQVDLESVASRGAHHNWMGKSGYFPEFVFYVE
jgi:hypothetical protein